MTYSKVTLPAALAAVADATDTTLVRYYEGSSAVVSDLAAGQGKVAGVWMSAHDGESAFAASPVTDAALQERLEAEYSVANQPPLFLPLGANVWAGQTPGSQQVTAPIQVEFQADGSVDVRVAPAWVEEFKGKTLFVALET